MCLTKVKKNRIVYLQTTIFPFVKVVLFQNDKIYLNSERTKVNFLCYITLDSLYWEIDVSMVLHTQHIQLVNYQFRDRRGRDHMVDGFTTTFAIGAYHHWFCESHSGRGVQHYLIKFVSHLQQVGGFLWVLRSPK